MRQPVLIFDFGNVVGFFDYTRIYEQLTPILGIEAGRVKCRLQEGGFAELMIQFESGRITPTEFAENVVGAIRIEDSL